MLSLQIRKTTADDLPEVMAVQARAFGQETEAGLTRDILADPTAQPALSVLAEEDSQPLGHILFSKVRLTEPESDCRAAILAPLAVVPEAQRRSIGGKLIEAGLERLRAGGVGLVFVLGDPGYYTRFGFQPAGRLGLAAPYPIPKEQADAWMVQALRDGVIGKVRGTVVCCAELNKPELWRE